MQKVVEIPPWLDALSTEALVICPHDGTACLRSELAELDELEDVTEQGVSGSSVGNEPAIVLGELRAEGGHLRTGWLPPIVENPSCPAHIDCGRGLVRIPSLRLRNNRYWL